MLRYFNGLMAMVICGVLAAAYGYQIIFQHQPCPLCWLQRSAMIAIALSALMNLYFGCKPAHYGLCIFSALSGMAVSLRHISLHICPTFGSFGSPVFGLSLYVWAFLIYAAVLLATASFLMLQDVHKPLEPTFGVWEKMISAIVALAIFGNVLSIGIQCGFSACK